MSARRRTAPSSPDRWMDLAVRYLARWDRTALQVEQFLLAQGASPARTKQIIDRLTDLRYLDDRAFAARWIESRFGRQPMGRARLKAELQAKGIAEQVVDRAIRDALPEVDEDTLARRALKAKQRRGRRLTPAQSMRLLHQWGFEEETIARIIGVRDEPE